MSETSTHKHDLAAAQRGLIIQRVLVDGRSPAQAGVPFGVNERQVARWVADYQRHGMASLRGEVAVEPAPHRWIVSWVVTVRFWLRGGLDGAPARRRISLRRRGEAGATNDLRRRSLWN